MLQNLFIKLRQDVYQRNYVLMAVVFAVVLQAAKLPAADGEWKVLFDGTSLNGWKPSQENDQFKLVDGVIVGSSSGQTKFLCSEAEFGDFELEVEVKLHDEDMNSGIQFRTKLVRANDKGDERPSIHGPQVDLGKSPGRSGHIFNQGNRSWITPAEQLVRNSLLINGQWNKVRVLAIGSKIQTWINGEQVSDFTVPADIHERYSTGVIALQVHGVKNPEQKTRHVSFKSIRIREIKN